MTEKIFDILVAGELNVDLILRGDVTPAFGQVEKVIDDADLTLGSSSAIFACGAARLGLKVAFVGIVGQDLFGEYVLRALAARGIDTRGVIVDPAVKTGLSVILARDAQTGGDRAILTHLGGSISDVRLEHIRPALAAARHLHFASYFLQDALRPDAPELFRLARQHGLTISMDTNYDPAEKWDDGLHALLPQVDLFLPNETEAVAIHGAAMHNAATHDAANHNAASSAAPGLESALDWLAARVPLTAVKLGAQGALARRGAQTWRAQPAPVQVVDTVGAGDSFDAGFVYAWLQGWPPEECLRMGNACGALSTRAAGGTPAQATLAEALAAMRH